jgi:hypothetical protein
MRIFMDTANIDDIRRGAAMGVVDGVTTNPTLVAKEGVEYRDRVLEICEVVDGPISAECISTGRRADRGFPTWRDGAPRAGARRVPGTQPAPGGYPVDGRSGGTAGTSAGLPPDPRVALGHVGSLRWSLG